MCGCTVCALSAVLEEGEWSASCSSCLILGARAPVYIGYEAGISYINSLTCQTVTRGDVMKKTGERVYMDSVSIR
jgi:hypothetical protein